MPRVLLPLVYFLGEKCTIEFAKYIGNVRTCIKLICEDGSPMATCTTNVPDEPLESDEVIIKTWSENEGILDALQEAGYIKKIVRSIPCGHTHGFVVKLKSEYVQ